MAPPRFLLPPIAPGATAVQLPEAVAHHAARVLRLRRGDPLVVFDGSGGEYPARFEPDPQAGAQALLGAFDATEREAVRPVTLIQALLAPDRLAWSIEKAVEFGAAQILVFPAARSASRAPAGGDERRAQRWRAIAESASCQCGRNRVPGVAWCGGIDEALRAATAPLRLVLDPRAERGLAQALGAPHATPLSPVAVLVGPEGGFTPEEMAGLSAQGVVAARLGRRVLRGEGAGLVALAAILALSGEFGGSMPRPDGS